MNMIKILNSEILLQKFLNGVELNMLVFLIHKQIESDQYLKWIVQAVE